MTTLRARALVASTPSPGKLEVATSSSCALGASPRRAVESADSLCRIRATLVAALRGQNGRTFSHGDVVQEILVSLIQRPEDLGPIAPEDLERYGRRAARSRLHDARRGEGRRGVLDNEWFFAEGVHRENPEELLGLLETIALVRDAIERLPSELREVVIVRELEGLTLAETASALGISETLATSRLRRARKRLRRLLSRAGLSITNRPLPAAGNGEQPSHEK